MTVEPDRELEVVEMLEHQPRVQKTNRVGDVPGRIHVYVDEADEMLPDLIALFSRETDIDIQRADKYEPPFDEIFRLLMQKSEVPA